MSHVDIHTTTIEETGEWFIDQVCLTDPYPFGIGKWMLETKYNKNFHGSILAISDPKIPAAHLIKSMLEQHQAYQRNLNILLQELIKKLERRVHEVGDVDKLFRILGDDFIEAWTELARSLRGAKPEPYREGYLTEIFHYWRTVAPTKEIRRFEDLWVFVAGRPHRQE